MAMDRGMTPEEIEFLVRQIWQRYRPLVLLGAVVLVAVGVLGTAFYSVPADSRGVVLRFGKYDRSTGPGLHMKMPYPIEEKELVAVQKVETLEFGRKTLESGKVSRYAPPTPERVSVSRMLTGDLNLALVEWSVLYRIKDAREYLFHIGGHRDAKIAVEDTICDVSEAVMRKIVGDASVDEVITIGRDRIADEAKLEIQAVLDRFEAGVEIVTVQLQSANPPDEVKDAFDEVNRARQNKERAVNEALGERNRQIPAARGKRARTISEAEGYRERMIQQTRGETQAFLAQLAEYKKVPEVTRTRLYLEAMGEVLGRVQNVLIVDEKLDGVLPLLDLDAVRGGAVKGGAR